MGAAGAAGKGPAILAKAAAEGSGTEGSVEAVAERKETDTVVALAAAVTAAAARPVASQALAPSAEAAKEATAAEERTADARAATVAAADTEAVKEAAVGGRGIPPVTAAVSAPVLQDWVEAAASAGADWSDPERVAPVVGEGTGLGCVAAEGEVETGRGCGAAAAVGEKGLGCGKAVGAKEKCMD